MKKNKQERGITLIALVITIIVLLILAGVAISMLSGENGILTRAAEAKEDTEEAQKEEETNLASMELETYFIINNLKYKCAYGYITGFEYDREEGHTVETVANVETKLPDGYKIVSKYEADGYGQNGKDIKFNDEEEKKNTYISTGMVIEKDGKEVARTVLFGDVDCNGEFTKSDPVAIMNVIKLKKEKYKEFQIVASDIDHDGIIKYDKANKFLYFIVGVKGGLNPDQNAYASNASKLKVESELEYQQEIIDNKLPEEFKESYKVYYNEEDECFILELGDSKEVTAVEILNKLGEKYDDSYIKVYREDGNKRITYGDEEDDEEIMGITVKENDQLYIKANNTTIICYIEIKQTK